MSLLSSRNLQKYSRISQDLEQTFDTHRHRDINPTTRGDKFGEGKTEQERKLRHNTRETVEN